MSKIIQAQEVWFAQFPFEEDSSTFKARPVIVLDVNENECQVLSIKVTTHM